jgi:tRNA (guanosine-2'-O-)-methyltransferase
MTSTRRRVERFRSVISRRQRDLTVVLENIHDPHNVSAILRSCDAVGILGVELLYTVEKFPKLGKKSSSSASKWIERRKHTDVALCYATLRQEGFRILATKVADDAPSLYDLDLTGPVAIVLGNEHRGVSDEAAAAADAIFRVPMNGMIESLNVSVAAAVCVFEAYRQRLSKGTLAHSALRPEDQSGILQDWLHR